MFGGLGIDFRPAALAAHLIDDTVVAGHFLHDGNLDQSIAGVHFTEAARPPLQHLAAPEPALAVGRPFFALNLAHARQTIVVVIDIIFIVDVFLHFADQPADFSEVTAPAVRTARLRRFFRGREKREDRENWQRQNS